MHSTALPGLGSRLPLSRSSFVVLQRPDDPSVSLSSRANVLIEALAAARVHRQAGLLAKAHQEPVYLPPEIPGQPVLQRHPGLLRVFGLLLHPLQPVCDPVHMGVHS